MSVGLLVLQLHLTEARSLKEKRMVLNRIKGRLRSRFNVSVAEVEHQDLWQRGAIAAVAVGADHDIVEKTLREASLEVERLYPGEVVGSETEFLV